jgi:linoleoyl-CoA desaturase
MISMKKVKFVSSSIREQDFAVAVRKNVNDYFKEKGISTKGNILMILQTIVMLSVYIVPFVLLITLSISAWVAAILVVLIGVGMAGVGMSVMHDGVHGSYSKRAWVNKIFGGTMYLLGSSVITWKIQHNYLHHAYTNIEGSDQDITSKGPIRLSEHTPLRKIHRYQYLHAFFFYGFMTFSKLIRDFSQLNSYRKSDATRKHLVHPKWEMAKMIIVKTVYLCVFVGLPFLLTPFSWWQILLGFFIMHWVAGFIMSTVFQMAHIVEIVEQPQTTPQGTIEHEWAVHEVKTTANFARKNLFLYWYIGGLNFQIEHHLFPNICHIHYRKIAPIVEKTIQEFGLTYNLKPTFLKALQSHVRRLKVLGRP